MAPRYSPATRYYKTEMCYHVVDGQNTCRYGEKCHYAHDVRELRPRNHHHRHRTVQCDKFHGDDCYCRFGRRCKFLH